VKTKMPLYVMHALVLALAVLGLVVGAGPEDEPTTPAEERLAAVSARISGDSLLATAEYLASQDTRRFTSQGAAAAVSYISGRLHDFDIPVEHHYVHVKDRSGNSVIVTNILADLGGNGFDKNTILVCAHYDSRGEDWQEPAPGADDNASGVAVLVETARVLAAEGHRPPVTLAFFGGEEDSLLGSNAFAENVLGDHPSLRGVVNVDMVGFDEYGPMDAVLFSNSHSAAFAGEVIDCAGTTSRLVIDSVIVETGNSDHVSFWRRGVAAVSLWEGYDHNPYHCTVLDTPDILTPRFLVEITRFVVSLSLCLGGETGGEGALGGSGGASDAISARLIGRATVAELPVIDGRMTELSRGGRVLARFSAARDRRTRREIHSAIGGIPGVYLVSLVSPNGAVPTEVIVVE